MHWLLKKSCIFEKLKQAFFKHHIHGSHLQTEESESKIRTRAKINRINNAAANC